MGYGALAASNGIPFGLTVASTAIIWALPAQIIFVEMHTLAAPVAATVLAVMLSSARFLPMTLVVMPEMRDSRHASWKYYVLAHLLSLSGWTLAMARFPQLPRRERLAWFYGAALVLMLVSALSTAAGHLGAEYLPPLAKLTLVFMAPMYYLLILTGSARERIAFLGLACGAVAGPLTYLVTPDWSVVLGGVVGGTVAFVLVKAR